jgi:hypothetical protein
VYKAEMLEAPGVQGEVVCAFAFSQMEVTKYLHIKNGKLHAVYNYQNGFKLLGNRNINQDGNDCLTAFLGLQLLHFKIPGFHGQPIDDLNGFKYADDDDERVEFPPVILTYATGGNV